MRLFHNVRHPLLITEQVGMDSLACEGNLDRVSIRPVIIFIVVDLPEPFGPRQPVISPCRAEKLTLSTTLMPAKLFETGRRLRHNGYDTTRIDKVPLSRIHSWVTRHSETASRVMPDRTRKLKRAWLPGCDRLVRRTHADMASLRRRG
jgi:hypothetical protein